MTDNFGDIDTSFTDYDSSKFIILPVSFDETSTWLKGADRGCASIIEASAHMELYDIETGTEVYKKGIHTSPSILNFKDPEALIREIHNRVLLNLKNEKFTVIIGGNHTVSIGSIKAHSEHYKDLTVLHLDAHSDMRDVYKGSKYNHACVMARAKEIAKPVMVGIRSMDSTEIQNIKDVDIFYADEVLNNPHCIKAILSCIKGNVYITIDLDVFDPSIMPSTGTPEPGGLTWYCVIDLLKAVIVEKNVVGFDVVELCPNENNKAPDFMTAKLIYKLLTYINVYS